MNLVASVFVVTAALCHVAFFAIELLLPSNPRLQAIFGVRPETVPAVQLWARNQAFYNLFLAAGPAAGFVLVHTGHTSAGRALAIYGCAFMALCGVVLLATGRRLWRGAVVQSVPPLVALVALFA